jgi:hypothetical protein
MLDSGIFFDNAQRMPVLETRRIREMRELPEYSEIFRFFKYIRG